MRVTIIINYHTHWGESLYIVGNTPELGDADESKAIKMDPIGDGYWQHTTSIDKAITVKYRFIVKSENGSIIKEWGRPHELNLSARLKNLTVYSQWQDCPEDKHYYSTALLSAINKRDSAPKCNKITRESIYISVNAPHISPDEVLMICGDCDAIGNWNPDQAVEMNDSEFPRWTASFNINTLPKEFHYKFIIVNKKTKKLIAWEKGENHHFIVSEQNQAETIAIEGLRLYDPLPNWRAAGVAIPVFSLRSSEDFGVGDFYDLKKLIDWAVATGMSFVQILPINDTSMTNTWHDSYPYNANSTYALHPMYLRIEEVGTLKNAHDMQQYHKLKNELNSLSDVDYERVNAAKSDYLKKVYSETGRKTLRQKKFKDFVTNNAHWLKPYAAYCVLRDKTGTSNYNMWEDMAIYNQKKVDSFIADNIDDINFIYFIQYHLDKQLREVRDYAHSKGVALKGDIPIGISRMSVDAWTNPRLFNLDCQAGAPPDDFSIMGQNWRFPTYNWHEMSIDDYQWWKNRFAKMSEYFDAYRIDHILGFFRIWEIPTTAIHGILGTFNPAIPYSSEELQRDYSFKMEPDLYALPYITEQCITDLFGIYTEEIKQNFLVAKGSGRYDLHPKYATQREIVNYFTVQEQNDKNDNIKESLLKLTEEILFIEDRKKRGYYHPRICAQNTHIYQSLSKENKHKFDKLYNDFFYHRHNEFWRENAMKKLPPLINSTDMLVCGEDLGMIPACVPMVMNTLKILSLEIQRMPKNQDEEFGNPKNYPYMSIASTSTHDMSGIRGWWEENKISTQHFYNNILHCAGEAPMKAESNICAQIISQHLSSPAMIVINPLQDWLSIDNDIRRKNPNDEQINNPSNPDHYWRYRMHINIEELLKHSDFNNLLFNKIQQSGRCER